VVVRPGKIDRSPTGAGRSARMATLSARGLVGEGGVYRACSIIGSEFICRIAGVTTIGLQPAIVPIISGRAWITGFSQYVLDYADPCRWATGFQIPGPAWGELLSALPGLIDAKMPTQRRGAARRSKQGSSTRALRSSRGVLQKRSNAVTTVNASQR
jgi:hypothetical protein